MSAAIGTGGFGASFLADGQLVAGGGIPAEYSAQTAPTLVGAFGTAAVALWPELTIIAERLNTTGDLNVVCFANMQAVLGDSSKFWSIAA